MGFRFAAQTSMAPGWAHVLSVLLIHTAAVSLPAAIPSCDKFAFIKTPKTGSTTFTNMLFRTAVMREMKIFKQYPGANITIDYNDPPRREGLHDIVMSHYATHCVKKGEFDKLLDWYGSVLGTDNFTLIASVREPVARYISHLKYFTFKMLLENTGKNWTIPEVLAANLHTNVMGCYFGIYDEAGARAFVNSAAFRRTLFLPSEHYSEGVAMVMSRCGWQLQHSAFLKNNPTTARWDVKIKEHVKDIAAANSVDAIIYTAALQQFNQQWESGTGQASGSLARLERCNKELRDRCNASKRAPECLWYGIMDGNFYPAILTQQGSVNMTVPILEGHSIDDLQTHGSQLCKGY